MTRAELHENMMVAFDTLRAHKGRSALTILGIVIGVTSVISVAAIITGLNQYIANKVEGFGAHTYFLSRIPAGSGGNRLPERIRVRKYFEYTDAEYIRETCPLVSFATTLGTRAIFFNSHDDNVISYENRRVEKFILRGSEPEYIDAIPLFSIERGRFLTKLDLEHARPVVIIGGGMADTLFPTVDPIGKEVRINGKLYNVIGVFAHDQGLFGGPGVDQFAVIPLTDFHKRYPEAKELFIAFVIPPGVNTALATDQVTEAVRRLRHVRQNQENDFELTSPDFLTNLWDKLTGALVLLTGVISSVGLLVGGIGVMNIMLISVTERTAEIGVRKAIGARRSDIRVQFLLEAVTLTVIGGLIGIFLGAIVAFAVRTVMPSIPASLSYLWIALGVGISVSVGVFFGYYPANRAANLDPIVCLRYE